MLLLLALVGSSLSLPGLGRQQLHAVEMQCRGQRATAACSGSTIMYNDSRSPPKKETGAAALPALRPFQRIAQGPPLPVICSAVAKC